MNDVMQVNAKPQLPIWGTLRDAVHLVKGTKRAIWLVMAAIIALSVVYGMVMGILSAILGPVIVRLPVFIKITLLVLAVLGYLFLLGSLLTGGLMVGIQRARGISIKVTDGLHYFKKHFIVPLGTTTILYLFIYFVIIYLFIFGVMFVAGMIIAVLDPTLILEIEQGHPFTANFFELFSNPHWPELLLLMLILSAMLTFVMEFLVFTLPLVVDKDLSTFTAIHSAFHFARRRWFRLFVILLLLQMVNKIALLPYELGLFFSNSWLVVGGAIISIGILVWLVPYVAVVLGLTYHRLVDDSSSC